MNQKNNTFYRFGERPVIGGEYCAFRDFDSLCGFLKMTGEANLVPIYELIGEVVDDDGGPDGFVVLVKDYMKLSGGNY